MDAFTLIGLVIVLYFFIYVVLLSISDCDFGLLYAIYFGKKLAELKGKVIWVTGASSGIGEFLAVELAKHGARVVISARSALNLERVKSRCLDVGATVGNILVLPFDVTDFARQEEYFLRVINHFGKLDILVNNAGRSQRATWEDIELEVDRQVFDLNVFSIVSLSRLAVKYFEKVGGGHIVINSSMASITPAPFSGSYTASKHAINGYMKSLLVEKVGRNIAVTILCPGPTFSNLLPSCFTTKKDQAFGEDMTKNDKRMETSRCAYLSAVAIVNRLTESWMGIFPNLPVMYMVTYFPNFCKKLLEVVGVKYAMKMRDSRQTVKTN